MSNGSLSSIKDVKETFQSLLELSKLLCTGLEPDTLAVCIQLCAAGINPELLASLLRELRKEIQNSQDRVGGSDVGR